MFRKMFGKLSSVTRKNYSRFLARKAIRAGLFKGIDLKAMEALRANFDDHRYRKYQDRFDHSLEAKFDKRTMQIHDAPAHIDRVLAT